MFHPKIFVEELLLQFKWNSDQAEVGLCTMISLCWPKVSSGCNWQGESEYGDITLKEIA
jgi:hypothetical protein